MITNVRLRDIKRNPRALYQRRAFGNDYGRCYSAENRLWTMGIRRYGGQIDKVCVNPSEDGVFTNGRSINGDAWRLT